MGTKGIESIVISGFRETTDKKWNQRSREGNIVPSCFRSQATHSSYRLQRQYLTDEITLEIMH